jgi:hypothetical protein
LSHDRILDVLSARAHAVRTRAAIRRWKYRQRNLAAGVWFHIRRTLADAKNAYVISEEDMRQLLAEGYKPEACGFRLAPEKTILFIDAARLDQVQSRRSIPVRLGPDFLLNPAIALVHFEPGRNG